MAAHSTWAMSAITIARDVVPFGVDTIVVCSQSGALSGIRFWKKFEPAHTVREALQQRRPVAHRAHDRLLDGEVVAGEVELGDARLGEHRLVRAADLHGVTGGDQLDRLAEVLALGHADTVCVARLAQPVA